MGSGKKPAARQFDIGSQHNGYVPSPIIAASGNVTINGRGAARKGDALVPHIRSNSPPHPRAIAGGVGSVKINGKPAPRAGDQIDCGGKISNGSATVFVGDGPKSGNAVKPEEWQAVMRKLTDASVDTSTPYKRHGVAGAEAVRFRGHEGGVASWAEYYENTIKSAERSGDPPPRTPAGAGPEEVEGFSRAQENVVEEKRQKAAIKRFQKAWVLDAARKAPEAWRQNREAGKVLEQFAGAEGERLAKGLADAAAEGVDTERMGMDGVMKPVKRFSEGESDQAVVEALDVATRAFAEQNGLDPEVAEQSMAAYKAQTLTAGAAAGTGKKGGWHDELEDPEPNSIYQVTSYHDGQPVTYTYETDHLGRTVRVKGKLARSVIDDSGERDKVHRNQRKQAEYGGPDDAYQGGHILGTVFQGPAEKVNVVPQLAQQNAGGEWYQMERDWQDELDEGNDVEVDIRLHYDDDGQTPSEYRTAYSVNGGRAIRDTFPNKPG